MTPTALRLRREAWGFGIGSAFFMLGAIPFYADAVGSVLDNLTFFIGSLFFTTAGFIQLALSGRRPPTRRMNRPDWFDWWAAAVQFVGTLLFNLSTIEALVTSINADTRLSDGWRPDAYGSIAFLLSSAFAVVATTERDRLWDPHARTWRGTWLNMLGSILFGISAVGAYVLPTTNDLVSQFWANAGTFLGAACFLAAAVTSRREQKLDGRRQPTGS